MRVGLAGPSGWTISDDACQCDGVNALWAFRPDTDTTTPARTGILARLFGSSGTRQQDMHITERRQLPGRDAVPSSPSDEQRLQLQNDTDTGSRAKNGHLSDGD